MNLNDIFQDQADSGTKKYWYLVVENGKFRCRSHEASELEKLASLLEGYKYTGSIHSIPSFRKIISL
jgi:hypothetical protein